MLPIRHCGFGRHRFACPLKLLVGGRWRLDGPNKSCLPALAICLGLILLRGLAAGLVASVPLVLSTELFAGGEWPDGPNKHWFQGLKRPDNAKHPYRDEKSLFCCGVADTVKTKFKVEAR